MTTIIHTLPKVDLSRALLGAVDAELLARLDDSIDAERAAEELAGYGKDGIESWLQGLDAVAARLQRPAQVETIAYVIGQRLIEESVVHVEMQVDPLRPALAPNLVVDALERGFERASEDSDDALLSWCILAEARRGDDAAAWAAAFATMQKAAGERLKAIVITGDERTEADALVAAVCAARAASETELGLVVTAGFGGGKKELTAALELEPTRVLHGGALLRFDEAIATLRARRVPVVALPGIDTRCSLGRAGAPPVLGRLIEAGLFATVASGAPGILASTMSEELESLSRSLGWRLDQMRTATARAVEAAYIDPKLRFVVARAVENWRHRPRLTAGSNDDGGYGL